MKWRGRERSTNIQDRRGATGRGGLSVGGATGGLGIGGLVVLLIIGAVFGINPLALLDGSMTTTTQAPSGGAPLPQAGEDEQADFVAVVVRDTEELWSQIFEASGLDYVYPTVVLYTQMDQSRCGLADARMGPFYCPADHSVYIDLSFYDELRDQFGAPGDFAQAYVIAHEIGHHVQNLTGVLPEFNRARQSMSTEEANAYSVRVELQADCYAGVWANYIGEANLLDNGDIAEAINAAEQIGDDAIITRSGGVPIPKTFTHGTSAQRQTWFSRGYQSGDPGDCDTFSGPI